MQIWQIGLRKKHCFIQVETRAQLNNEKGSLYRKYANTASTHRYWQKPRLCKFFSREIDFMRYFPVAFLANGIFIVTHAGFELTTAIL